MELLSLLEWSLGKQKQKQKSELNIIIPTSNLKFHEKVTLVISHNSLRSLMRLDLSATFSLGNASPEILMSFLDEILFSPQ